MPHVDKRSGEMVIRIVYDGAPEAGKTTNIHRLTSMIPLQRRGAVETPGPRSRRTEFFDWLDFSGGFLDGRRVRCQLVSVPGQSHLLHRRRYLLEAADAVIFVADSRRERLDEARKDLATTRRILAALGPQVPVGVVVQANKQDQSGALSARELGAALELPPTIAVVPSVATAGDGVMQTFILATRLATDRVRAMLYGPELLDLAVEHETPGALYGAIVSLDADRGAEAAMTDGIEMLEDGQHPRLATGHPPRRNACSPDLKSRLGPGLEVSAGHVWPPVKGRALLANAGLASLEIPEFVAPWAPSGSIELRTSDGWVLHSADRWLFHEEAPARFELLTLVRRQLEWADFVPEGRTLFLAGEGRSWRLWILTARSETLREALIEALHRRDVEAIRRVWADAAEVSRWLAEAPPATGIVAGIDTLSFMAGRPVVLAINEGGSRASGPPADLLAHLRDVASVYAAEDQGAMEWLEAHGGLPRQ